MNSEQNGETSRTATWIGILLGLVIPSAITWLFFVHAARYGEGAQRTIGLTVKVLQFALPIVWTVCILGQRPRLRPTHGRGIKLGIAFGVVVTAVGWVVFETFLRDSPMFVEVAEKIADKVAGFGLDSVAKYAMLGLFYSLVHSLLEEYYWRWFVFGQLHRVAPLSWSIVVSAIGFAAHHVIVLAQFFDGLGWATLLFSAAVAVGGAFWAWLYQHSGSLLGPWWSHLVIDAGLFWIGYDLIGGRIADGGL